MLTETFKGMDMEPRKYASLALRIATVTAMGVMGFSSIPAVADTRNPTDIFATFYDLGDTPLRYGIAAQYGKVHIEADHKAQVTRVGWDHILLDIEHTFHDGKCGKPHTGKIVCEVMGGLHGGYKSMRVIYTDNAHGMPDGRPKGIITAFYP